MLSFHLIHLIHCLVHLTKCRHVCGCICWSFHFSNSNIAAPPLLCSVLLSCHHVPVPVPALASRVSCPVVVTGAPDPPWRLSQCPCPASASRAPTLPPRCCCCGAGRAFREGEIMSRICLSSTIHNARPHLISPEP